MQVRERIREAAEALTASERKLAAVILSDYPYSGLASIQDLARHAEVSAPSISRFVSKIGLSGYQEFQRELISELKEGERSPLELHKGTREIEGGYLGDFMARATSLMTAAPNAITDDQFDRTCALLADPKRELHIIGGRVSNALALVLAFHLGQVRSGVQHLPADVELWPEYLLRMKSGDVVLLIDFRRYQTSLLRLSKAAHERGARIVLVTDKWLSPVAKYAAEVLTVPIETGTLWDSYAPALAVIEAIFTKIAEDNFEQTQRRIQAWDAVRMTDRDTSR